MTERVFALAIFIVAYILFVVFPNRRTPTAVGASLLLILTRTVSLNEAIFSVNWNVIGISVGMLLVADVFMYSRVPAYAAEVMIDKAPNTAWALLFICMMSGFISAFVENVATVLIVAPVALSLSHKLKINPLAMMIGIAVSSNLQGCATLIGDPPSMLLGGYTGMNFMDFIFYKGRPSIFFAVELGALASFVILYFFFAEHKQKMKLIPVEKVVSWVPTVILVTLIVLLGGSSMLGLKFKYTAGTLCLLAGLVSIVWLKLSTREPLVERVLSLDWDTRFFLVGVFVLVGSLTVTGWIDSISDALGKVVGTNLVVGYIVIVSVSVLLSAVIDNVPFMAAMLPVGSDMAQNLQIEPSLILFGLLIGTSLGGNITPIGASANVVACGILKKEGITVTFGDFMKIGIPFTLAAVFVGALFVWLVWS